MPKKKYPYQNLSLDSMPGEQWEDVPGLDGYFCLSNFGRVKRESFEIQSKDGKIRLLPSKIVKPELILIWNNTVKDNVFFLRAKAMLSGKRYQISIARLVYYCFVRPFDLDDKNLVVLTKDADGRNIFPGNLILGDIRRKQIRIFERDRLKRTFFYTYDEFLQYGVETSVNPFCKQVSQYTMKGKKIKTFPSIRAAAKDLNISEAGINSVLKERQISCGGYVWRYGRGKRVDMKGLRESKKIKLLKERGLKVTQYDLEGKKIASYLAISEAARKTGIRNGDISVAVSGKQKTAGGFIWKKGWGEETIDVKDFLYGAALRAKKAEKKIARYTLEGKYVRTFSSVKEAARFAGIHPSAISGAIGRGSNIAGGYKWKFV